MYKVYVDVVESLIALSICVLRSFIQLSKVDVKKLLNADWISVKLKEKTVIVLLIKLMFIWTIKNQSVKDQITQSERNLQREDI